MALLVFKLFVVLQLLALLQSSTVVVAKAVVAQGSVYCKACKYRGKDTLEGATPLEGAVVELSCKNGQNPLKQKATTNKDGTFLFKKPKRLSLDDFKMCTASLLSSPVGSCNSPTDLNFGITGSTLNLTHKVTTRKSLDSDLFSIKPFALEPSAEGSCNDLKPNECPRNVLSSEVCVYVAEGVQVCLQ